MEEFKPVDAKRPCADAEVYRNERTWDELVKCGLTGEWCRHDGNHHRCFFHTAK